MGHPRATHARAGSVRSGTQVSASCSTWHALSRQRHHVQQWSWATAPAAALQQHAAAVLSQECVCLAITPTWRWMQLACSLRALHSPLTALAAESFRAQRFVRNDDMAAWH